jgi:hypothetical protein
MQRALAMIVMLAAIDIATGAELRTKDIVGGWTLRVADDYAYYTFWSNFTYTGSKGDMLFEGRWKLLKGNRLQLDPSFFDRGVIVINSFDGHTLRAILPNGKKDVWKKMPRWRGSPKY